MKFLPAFLNIQNENCLVVGGGEVAARKVALLRRAGGRVLVTAPELCDRLARARDENEIEFHPGNFDESLIDNCVLVIAATDDIEVNRQVSEQARARHLPVNVVDQPELCSFIMPSIVDRSPVLVAVSSGGSSPVLARLLRARLETLIPAAYGRLAELIQGYRQKVKDKFATTSQRRRFWEHILQGPIAEMLFAGQEKQAERALLNEINRHDDDAPLTGEVYLVGAGPGDPDLLTFRALRLMQQADVVLHDRLVADEILDLVRRDAERIYVGKARASHAVPQPKINDLLVTLAQQGKRVLRLKGGDPFIFGRGGEEIDRLAQEGINFQVVPGVTAAAGCAAYSGIPLTHRDHAQSCVFVTGHLQDGSFNLNWSALIQPEQTVVIYMGLTGLTELCRQFIDHGMDPTMPAALVEQGTTRRQRVLTGTVDNLPQLVDQAKVHAPTLIIIGQVVQLHEKLAWFEPTGPAPD